MTHTTRHELSRAAALSSAAVLIGLLLWGRLLIRDDVPRTPFVARNAGLATLRALPELLIPVVMIAMLAKGFQIPEAAAFTTVYVASGVAAGVSAAASSTRPPSRGSTIRSRSLESSGGAPADARDHRRPGPMLPPRSRTVPGGC